MQSIEAKLTSQGHRKEDLQKKVKDHISDMKVEHRSDEQMLGKYKEIKSQLNTIKDNLRLESLRTAWTSCIIQIYFFLPRRITQSYTNLILNIQCS